MTDTLNIYKLSLCRQCLNWTNMFVFNKKCYLCAYMRWYRDRQKELCIRLYHIWEFPSSLKLVEATNFMYYNVTKRARKNDEMTRLVYLSRTFDHQCIPCKESRFECWFWEFAYFRVLLFRTWIYLDIQFGREQIIISPY